MMMITLNKPWHFKPKIKSNQLNNIYLFDTKKNKNNSKFNIAN